MEKIYLENARGIFLGELRNDVYYEGSSLKPFNILLEMIGYICPNRITPTELIVYLRFLIKDIKDNVCRFQNSKRFKELFEQFELIGKDKIEFYLSYMPSFIKAVSKEEFYNEFIELFKSLIYQQDEIKEEDYGYIEVEKDYIDISNKDVADVLCALYNHAKPIGIGIVHYDSTPMTKDIAVIFLEKETNFDYLKGRPIKISFDTNVIYVGQYNCDNDQEGLAQKAIATCPNIRRTR